MILLCKLLECFIETLYSPFFSSWQLATFNRPQVFMWLHRFVWVCVDDWTMKLKRMNDKQRKHDTKYESEPPLKLQNTCHVDSRHSFHLFARASNVYSQGTRHPAHTYSYWCNMALILYGPNWRHTNFFDMVSLTHRWCCDLWPMTE